ncbi:MAG: molybdopterin/thiamine biosynthesis adenylyltransferase/molybdopterin synthase catalytic subunit [Chlamydiales bacterium]|jgi:molybdopterin/thiamine biosynthesis adenylyltransferase/molybdopterin synthase catalytic subunit/rhodanese-related sulfurtransferase
MFTLAHEKIDEDLLKNKMPDACAGACVTFAGWVRNHHLGKAVDSLEYEAFEELALSEGAKIIEEAKEKFPIYNAHCVHRTGLLQVGEIAIWIGVSSAHREGAYLANRFLIDEFKSRLPIWKKEHYTNGKSEWVNCQGCAHKESPSKEMFYSRQVILKDFKQSQLENSRVLVIGAGGLGCPALTYLSGAGIGHLGISDGDTLDASNLHRQTLYSNDDVGKLKCDLAANRLKALNPFITINTHPTRFSPENAEAILYDYDLVLDCTDNFTTRFLIHDTCYLMGKPLVQASVYQMEGMLQTFLPESDGGCLRCQWPKTPEEGCTGTCSETGIIGVVPGLLGTMQALEAIKILQNWDDVLSKETLLVELLSNVNMKIQRKKNPDCPLCGEGKVSFSEEPSDDREIPSITDQVLRQFEFIDIRDLEEIKEEIQSLHIPMHDFEAFTQLSPDKNYLLFCQKGIRSKNLAQRLLDRGYKNFYSLQGGIHTMTATVDCSS